MRKRRDRWTEFGMSIRLASRRNSIELESPIYQNMVCEKEYTPWLSILLRLETRYIRGACVNVERIYLVLRMSAPKVLNMLRDNDLVAALVVSSTGTLYGLLRGSCPMFERIV